jgi:nitric oxide reductase activation protein
MNPSDKYEHEQIKDIKHLNPVEQEAMVLKHDQQIKDIAKHLLELKQLVTPMMEFKRREWVGLTGPEVDEAYRSVSDKEWAIGGLADARVFFCAIEAKLKEKNGG